MKFVSDFLAASICAEVIHEEPSEWEARRAERKLQTAGFNALFKERPFCCISYVLLSFRDKHGSIY
jgi:hypothetical protein